MSQPQVPRGVPQRRRRGWVRPVVALALVTVPIAEIWTIVQVGGLVGPWWTIALLLAGSVLGAWLVRREGGRAWRALREALQAGRMPAREIADGMLVLLGGGLILLPGFLLDVVGLVLILPFTRPVARRLLTSVVERRLVEAPTLGGRFGPGFRPGFGPGAAPGNGDRPGPGGDGPVVRGDVVE